MATKPLPDQALLLKLLRYEPETGKLFWRERPSEMFKLRSGKVSLGNSKQWNSRYAGKEAFTAKTGAGYFHGNINKQNFTSHRLIWRMMTGFEPVCIDHINGDRSDNRFCNLRDVSVRDNQCNTAISSLNTSGCAGVGYVKRYNRWRARIKHKGHDIHLGHFKSKDEAIRVKKAAERELGFHPNHGRGGK